MDEAAGDEAADLPEDLVPLCRAAALVYEHVYRRVAAADQQTGQNVMAQALCGLSPLYAYDERKQRIRALGAFELAGAVVADGGRKLRFADKRPELARIAIRVGDMRKVMQTLIESGITFAEIKALYSGG
jgi:hypothetical protein